VGAAAGPARRRAFSCKRCALTAAQAAYVLRLFLAEAAVISDTYLGGAEYMSSTRKLR